MAGDLKTLAERTYKEQDFHDKTAKYDYCRPFTKESVLYRELFERYYPARQKWSRTSGGPTKPGLAAMWTTYPQGCFPNTGTAENSRQGNRVRFRSQAIKEI